MSIDLKNRVIMVTGAARGLGLAYSKSLLECGAVVAMQDGGVDTDGENPDPQVIENAAADLGSENAFPIAGLLNSRKDCATLIETVITRFGRIDGIVVNAGVVIWRDTAEVDETDFRSSSAINHEAAFWLCQAALPHMREAGFGRIVLTSSGWALGPYPGSDQLTLYCLSKGAQFGLGMALAEGAGHPDIKTNVIAPIADTRIYASEVEKGRLRPQSVAGTVAWLMSPDCQVNGQLLKVADGNVSVLQITEIGSAFLGETAENPGECGNAVNAILAGK